MIISIVKYKFICDQLLGVFIIIALNDDQLISLKQQASTKPNIKLHDFPKLESGQDDDTQPTWKTIQRLFKTAIS